MIDVYKKIQEAIEKNMQIWIATVVESIESTPAEIGMKMIIYSDGKIFGTIGGGEIEKKVIEKVINEKPKKSTKWKFNLGLDNHCEGTSMICGGIQEILIECLYSEPLLYIIGAGHCAISLSSLAAKTNFLPIVIDNREEWANKEKHPFANKCLVINYENILDYIDFNEDIYIVIMTHGHQYDEFILRKIIDKKYKYLGMIGSLNKIKVIFEKMIEEGFDKDLLKKIFSPIGFNIGSHTPEEIAISIMAQLIAVKNGKNEIKFNMNPIK